MFFTFILANVFIRIYYGLSTYYINSPYQLTDNIREYNMHEELKFQSISKLS